ncbi:ATP-binding protein [Galbibacter sp. EGI 63066]|uniref:ATP-binding protein n=1 Tax=Galbibacter sp. EGI 63066 TaxID=2993559 RepID=UPI002248A727|nr:ATP-binding protein [Galbibacter sp. EGI 63066]MCX2678851.1 ATP-binding protein [Galbibacter sp. EGI 63066]
MKFRHSIVTRAALFFTGLIIFAILLSGYLVFEKSSKVITEYSKKRITYVSQLAEQSFYALLGEVSNDIAVIASSPTLQNYVANSDKEATQDIDQLFYTILKNKKSYFQIRYIGVENNGKEIIRFDKEEGKIVKSDDLQEKGDRDYFKEAVHIKADELYFSKINLNEEYGVISEPHIPTLRAASPIFNNGQIKGIVIINVDLRDLYNTLGQISGLEPEPQLYLIDAEGQYLYAPEEQKTFALQKKSNYNFYADFNIDQESILPVTGEEAGSPKTINDHYLSYTRELGYFNKKRKIYFISLIEESVLLQSARAVGKNSIQTLVWVCLLSILISWFFVNFFSKKINQVTNAISNYDKGKTTTINLPTNRKDEIGVLAKAFTKMKAKIDQNVEKLNTSLEKEKQAKAQRDEFLQNMSHEMRTPLNAIQGLIQLLYKNSPSEDQGPIINSLERSANNLAGLVYDVLDHKKLVEGALKIEYKTTNIAALLKEIHSSYQYDALQKGLKFTIDIDKKLEEQTYQTDPLRLSQIVINLIVNAIKFTYEGTIKLQAHISQEDKLTIKVTDTGIGIKAENLSKINDRFFQEGEGLSGRYGGYGLGLSIVKQLTGLFGGTLKATSEKEVGSEFCVTLPVLPTTAEDVTNNKDRQAPLLPTLSKNYKVLHIEDDISTTELIKHVLADDAIDITQLNNPETAVNYLEANKPDLVISDLLLGQEKFYPVLQQLIKEKKITCPVIITSALEPEKLQRKIWHFQKPFRVEELKDAVYTLLGSREWTAPDFSNIYSNYDEEAQKIKKVLDLLHKEFETYLDRIDKAVADANQKEWESIQHKLIVHINNLKLDELSALFPQQIMALKKEDLEKINNAFAFYMCCFRVERTLI